MRTLTIVQPYVPRYRTAFYEKAGRKLLAEEIILRVLVGRRDSNRSDADARYPVVVRRDHLEARTSGRLRFRDLHGVAGDPGDLLLLEQAIKNLDGYVPLLSQRCRGPSVGLWGHGRSYSSRQSRPLAKVKQWMTRRADWFFAYTASGARDVVTNNFPPERVTVLNNTLDTEALSRDLRVLRPADQDSWSTAHGLDPRMTAAFIGGIDSRKGLAYLVAAAAQAHRLEPTFRLVLAGSGADEERLRELEARGAPLRVVGRADGTKKALVLKSAALLAVPAQLGLVVVDSFVAGRPIITLHDNLHGPEAEYLEPGSDSLWLTSSASPQEYGTTLVMLLRQRARLHSMQRTCLSKAPLYSMDAMVGSFVGGVRSWAQATDLPLARAQRH